jgi:putative iron-dependent peroxidase
MKESFPMRENFCQPGILKPIPPCGRSLLFRLQPESDARSALLRLRAGFEAAWGVVGIGAPLVQALAADIAGLRTFPALSGPACTVPSTQQALWIFLGGEERGALFDRSERIKAWLGDAFLLESAVDTFLYAGGRDLTGYEDGTENPDADSSIDVALVADGQGLRGSSFVAVQTWAHDLPHFHDHTPQQRDLMIGRQQESNEELADAPASAHVKRSAQEDYEPPAFMLRRSMPWATAHEQGLEFIAYGHSLDAYERVLRRMLGLDDGIVDALFTFSRPLSGGYYWCPPLAEGRLDLAALKL